MAFQTKNFVSIVASMINWMKATQSKITDFSIGSVARTLVEAPAAEIDELYQQMFIGLKEAIPVSIYNSFNFALLPIARATGLVRVTITAVAGPTIILANAGFTLPNGTLYNSTGDVTIAAGLTFADVPVAAAMAGSAGNVAPNKLFAMTPTPATLVSASNISAFSSGADGETEDQRKLRFNSYISSLNRGTVASLKYAMKTVTVADAGGNVTERVLSATVIEPFILDALQPVSLVNCFIHNGVGATSAALLANTVKALYGYVDVNGNVIAGWKAAGVNVQVYLATETAVPITGTVAALPGFDKPALVTAMTSAIDAYIKGLDIGVNAVKSEIIRQAMQVPGAYNIILSAPAADVVAGVSAKLMPGAYSLT